MPIIKGKRIEALTAKEAYKLGYLSPAEFLSTQRAEVVKNECGLYAPKIVFENGIYKGTTRKGERIIDTYDRLNLL